MIQVTTARMRVRINNLVVKEVIADRKCLLLQPLNAVQGIIAVDVRYHQHQLIILLGTYVPQVLFALEDPNILHPVPLAHI